MAQLVEHWVVMLEVVCLTPAGPTLRVVKCRNRKCCLCTYISKWLDFKFFSDKDYKLEVPSHNPCRKNNCETLKNPNTINFVKSEGTEFSVLWSGLYGAAVIG